MNRRLSFLCIFFSIILSILHNSFRESGFAVILNYGSPVFLWFFIFFRLRFINEKIVSEEETITMRDYRQKKILKFFLIGMIIVFFVEMLERFMQ